MKMTPIESHIGTIVALTADGAPLVLFDGATTPVEARIEASRVLTPGATTVKGLAVLQVSREHLERAIIEQQVVIGFFSDDDTKPTILVSRNQPLPLHRPDDESVWTRSSPQFRSSVAIGSRPRQSGAPSECG